MIYFDEAGNTGDNLLDPSQPAFTLLSHDFDEEESTSILTALRDKVKSEELHFARLRKQVSNRKHFEAIFNHDLILDNRIFYYTADKFFVTTIHIIDRLLEYVMDIMGYDLYQEGQNLTSANMLHILGTSICNKNEYRHACVLFLKWVKEKTGSAANSFYQQWAKVIQTCPVHMRRLLELIMSSRQYTGEITLGFDDKYTLDPTLSMFKASTVHWSKYHSSIEKVFVDTSKPLAYFEDLLEFQKNADDIIVGYGRNQYNFKLKVKEIIPVDSKKYPQIQLADILVSGVNYHVKSIIENTHDPLSAMISESKMYNVMSRNAMWPTSDVTPASIGMEGETKGINPLDYFATQALKHNFKSK